MSAGREERDSREPIPPEFIWLVKAGFVVCSGDSFEASWAELFALWVGLLVSTPVEEAIVAEVLAEGVAFWDSI